MAVDLTGTAGADTVTLTTAQASFNVDLAGDYDVLFLPAVVTNVTVLNTEVVVGSTANDTVTVDSSTTMPETVSLGGASDTLKFGGTNFDLTSTTLVSVEKLQATAGSATTFTVDQKDIASVQSILGTSGNDILKAAGTELDVGAATQTLSSVEILMAGNAADTTFRVNQKDLASGGSILGAAGTDSLVTRDATIDLTSTTVSSVEILRAGVNTATTFTLDATDLASFGSILGASGSDTLVVKDTAFDLSSTSITSVETLKAGKAGTTFTVDSAALAVATSIVGSAASWRERPMTTPPSPAVAYASATSQRIFARTRLPSSSSRCSTATTRRISRSSAIPMSSTATSTRT
jgi:hypothetical protein